MDYLPKHRISDESRILDLFYKILIWERRLRGCKRIENSNAWGAFLTEAGETRIRPPMPDLRN
jgi:hypothetical protein